MERQGVFLGLWYMSLYEGTPDNSYTVFQGIKPLRPPGLGRFCSVLLYIPVAKSETEYIAYQIAKISERGEVYYSPCMFILHAAWQQLLSY